jgi:KaiC/GvpD/RAD55 family RecA-like ATPase
MDIENYLTSKGFEFKREGQEFVLTCPQCGKPKWYINSVSGKYQCFVCKAEKPESLYAQGHISKIKEQLGDILPIFSISDSIEPNKNQQEVDYTDQVEEYHSLLLEDKSALKYLFRRGITEESIHRFKLGTTRRYNQSWLSIPSFESGIPKLIKYRKLPPDENEKLAKYIRESGSKSILFNADSIESYDEIILTEGELDAITLIQAGYENIVGITGGAGTFLPEWFDMLNTKMKIYLCLDADSAGQNSAKDVWATRLGLNRCWNISLPDGYDINEFFLENSKEDFIELIQKARQFKIDGVISVKEALYEMYRKATDESNVASYSLPWENVNKLIGGGLVRQRLTVLGGSPGTGKTSFAMQICYHMAKVHNIPCFFFCLEMPEVSLATKIVQLHYDYSFSEIDPINGMIYAMELKDLPIYLGYSSKITPEVFYNTMLEVRNRFGVGLGCFDNLQRLIRSDRESDMGKASGMFKDLVMDLNIMFLLVSQPRKMNSEDEPTYDSLKGSSSIPADADEVLLLHRKRLLSEDGSSSMEPITKIIVDKSRFSSGGRTKLNFLGDRSRFEEIEA